MNPIKRAWLFARDYIDEFGCAWGLARMRDCERMGGHRWNEVADDPVLGRCKTCKRCGCGEPVYSPIYTANTAASSASNFTIRYP
jgi:hypothetical protein